MATHIFAMNNVRLWRVDAADIARVIALLDSVAIIEPGQNRETALPAVERAGARAGG